MSTLTRLEAVTSSNIRLIGVEQEMMLRPRHPRRQMREDEVVPAVISDQPVGGGEIDADLPLLRAHPVLHRRDFDRRQGMRLGHALSDCVDASHHRLLSRAVLAVRRAGRDPVGMGGGEGIDRRSLGIAANQRRIGAKSTSKRRALNICGTRQMSAVVTLSPNRKRPARALASASSAAKPSRIQWRYQSSRESSSMPSAESRFSTRKLLIGWMSHGDRQRTTRRHGRDRPCRPGARAARRWSGRASR